jgi:hypothetical protein
LDLGFVPQKTKSKVARLGIFTAMKIWEKTMTSVRKDHAMETDRGHGGILPHLAGVSERLNVKAALAFGLYMVAKRKISAPCRELENNNVATLRIILA